MLTTRKRGAPHYLELLWADLRKRRAEQAAPAEAERKGVESDKRAKSRCLVAKKPPFW